MLSSTFDLVRALVLERSGLELGPDKDYLVDARLAPLAREAGLAGIDELVATLDRRGPLADRVVEAMLTCETSFFRDPEAFRALSGHILPAVERARAGERRLSIWSAACASGQEPYGVAMLLRDGFAHLQRAGWVVRLVATDLSEAMVRRAAAGLYTPLEVNRGLPADCLVRHFRREGVDWQVVPEVRRQVEFRRLNLVADAPPLYPLDVVLLRNVLIYFGTATKRAVLERIRAALRPDGFLLLGSAETTLGLHEGFEPVGQGQPGWFRRCAWKEAGRAVP